MYPKNCYAIEQETTSVLTDIIAFNFVFSYGNESFSFNFKIYIYLKNISIFLYSLT